MNIYLVRHGQSEGNIDPSIYTHTADHAIPLSDLGREQAKEAGQFLARHLEIRDGGSPESIRFWTSPYSRARETAAVMRAQFGAYHTDIREHINLCEQQFGLFDGIPEGELAERFPEEHAHYEKCERHEGRFWARMPLGESRFDVAVRVHQAFGTFHRDADKHGVNDIVVVCHGVTLRAFVMQWLHLTVEWFEAEPNPVNGAIRLIENGVDLGYLWPE